MSALTQPWWLGTGRERGHRDHMGLRLRRQNPASGHSSNGPAVCRPGCSSAGRGPCARHGRREGHPGAQRARCAGQARLGPPPEVGDSAAAPSDPAFGPVRAGCRPVRPHWAFYAGLELRSSRLRGEREELVTSLGAPGTLDGRGGGGEHRGAQRRTAGPGLCPHAGSAPSEPKAVGFSRGKKWIMGGGEGEALRARAGARELCKASCP